MKKRKQVSACRASITTMLIPGLILATDIRPRNTSGSKITLGNGANNSTIVNINAPHNGVSQNVYDRFDVNGNVVLNNSLNAGTSILAGFIGKNPNFEKTSADLIITEVRSQDISNIRGAVEVFGRSAKLVFANENGFGIGDTVFFNTKGVSFAGGSFKDNRVVTGQKSKIDITGNVQVDGSYFNVIAKKINFVGNILTTTGKPLDAINFIAGQNEVNLQNPENPTINKQQSTGNAEAGISGALVGSMNGNTVRFVTTGRGVGVHHSGAIFTLGDIILASEGNVDVQSVRTAKAKQNKTRGDITISGENISVGILSGENIQLKATSNVRNRGIIDAENLQVKAQSYQNIFDRNGLKLQNIEGFDGVATVNAGVANFNVDRLENDGKIYAQTASIATRSFQNRHELLGENIEVALRGNSFDNRNGIVAASHNLLLRTNQIGSKLVLEDGRFYGGNTATISSPGVVEIKGKVESPGSISIQAKAVINSGLLATKGGISFAIDGLGKLRNDGYLYGNTGINVLRSVEIINNGGIHSNGDINLASNNIINNGGIWGRNVNLEAESILNSAQLRGSVSKRASGSLSGRGGVNYGDTAWKTWRSEIAISGIPSFSNNLTSENSLIWASNDININYKSKRGNLTNNGWILAGRNVNTGGNVRNITLVQEMRVEDILKTISSGGITNQEYLGRWKTNQISYLKYNSNLWDMLNFMADTRNKQHQRESAWNALKNLASKNADLNNLLSQYLGADYKNKRLIPEKRLWRTNAKIVFSPNNGARISGRQNVNITGNGFKQGISTELNNSIALLESKIRYSNQSKENLKENLAGLNKGGLFREVGGIQDGVRRKFTSASNFIDQNGLYGIGYFLQQSGRRVGDGVVGIGDNYYEFLYLTRYYGDIYGGMDKDKIKELLENGAKYARENPSLGVGVRLGEQQIEKLDKDMIWYVDIGDKSGEAILVPVVYLTQETASHAGFSPTVSGGNININVHDLSTSLGRIEGLDKVSLVANGTGGFYGSQVSGESVNIGAGKINIESLLGHTDGTLGNLSQSMIVGAENVNIFSNGDLMVKNGLIQGVSGDSSVKLMAIGGDVYILNDYTQSSQYQQINDGGSRVISSSVTTGILSSSISGGQVAVGAGGSINIKGSNINGVNHVSLVGGSVDIQGASSVSDQKYSSTNTGVQSNGIGYVQYQRGENQVTTYNGSNVTSEGDLQISTAGSLNIVGSNLSGKEAMDLVSQYLTVTHAYNTANSLQEGSSLSVLNYHEQSTHNSNKTVVGSNLEGGNIAIQTKDGTISGSNINGTGNVSITAENLDLVAAKNESNTTTKGIGIGVFGGAVINLAGQGVEVSLENGETNTTFINGFNNGVTSGGIRSEVLGNTNIGVKVVVETTEQNSVNHTSSNLNGKNLAINVGGTTDIGGANLKAENNIDVISGNIQNTQYTDSVDMSSMKWSVYVQDKVEITSQLVATINQQADQITALTNGEKPNIALSAVGAVAEAYNVVTSPIAGVTNYIGGGISVDTSEEHKRTETIHSVNAGGNINVVSTKGDINLSGINLKGGDIVIDSNGNIIARGTGTSSNSKNTSLTIEGNFETSGNLSIRDGGSITFGSDGVLAASQSNSSSVTYQNSSWDSQGNLKLRSKGDVVLVGVNAAGQTVTLKIDGNLNTQSLVDRQKSESFNAVSIGVVGVGASSQHIVTGNATGVVDFGYKTNSSTNINTQTSIKGESIRGSIGGNLGLQASIISATGKGGDLNIGGLVLDESIITHSHADGARVRLVVTTEGATGGAIDIDDHLNSATQVGNALGVTINGSQTNINADINNTKEQIVYEAWKGGSINVTPASKQKLKNLKERFEGN